MKDLSSNRLKIIIAALLRPPQSAGCLEETLRKGKRERRERKMWVVRNPWERVRTAGVGYQVAINQVRPQEIVVQFPLNISTREINDSRRNVTDGHLQDGNVYMSKLVSVWGDEEEAKAQAERDRFGDQTLIFAGYLGTILIDLKVGIGVNERSYKFGIGFERCEASRGVEKPQIQKQLISVIYGTPWIQGPAA
ncbi:hypothetical protein Sjap_014669 [Stephania japonica]|uniref:Uncharacterized protein n=1 Tax=Stephania japonica TaxID=461633 RepID=A0AAP0II17_9MAGN